MQIILEVPDEVACQFDSQPAILTRRILELIAADSYRQGRIGAAEVRRMLGFTSRWETYEFLKQEKADMPYTQDDLEQDALALTKVLETE